MNEFLDQALNKLAETVSGQKENAMAPSVREALTDFCRQDAEFAQAVAQGGSFKDCMAAVAKGVGGSISDLEAYARRCASTSRARMFASAWRSTSARRRRKRRVLRHRRRSLTLRTFCEVTVCGAI